MSRLPGTRSGCSRGDDPKGNIDFDAKRNARSGYGRASTAGLRGVNDDVETLAGDPRVTDPPRETFGCARTGALSNTYLIAARRRAGFSASSPSRKRRNATTAASSALIPSICSAR